MDCVYKNVQFGSNRTLAQKLEASIPWCPFSEEIFLQVFFRQFKTKQKENQHFFRSFIVPSPALWDLAHHGIYTADCTKILKRRKNKKTAAQPKPTKIVGNDKLCFLLTIYRNCWRGRIDFTTTGENQPQVAQKMVRGLQVAFFVWLPHSQQMI